MKQDLNNMLLTSAEKRKDETLSQLVDLWATVFGDSEAYIKLIAPYFELFDCYAIKEEGKIVSAFYLLPSEIKAGEKIYKGKYLYAAATYEEHRKNGYMSRLINEAINDNKNELSFISLVPANEGLYSYYSRFGFETLMYNCVTKLNCDGDGKNDCDTVNDGKAINSLRKDKFDCVHLYNDEAMNYVLDCYGHFGSFFRFYENSAVLYVEDENTVYEAVFDATEKDALLKYVRENYQGEITVITPYKLDGTTKKNKCGMILDFSGELENSIYMNHTLI